MNKRVNKSEYTIFSPAEAIEKLLSNSVQVDGPLETQCRIWTGLKTFNGYGQISVCGITFLTHRLAYDGVNFVQ